jgi:hypothetical protein
MIGNGTIAPSMLPGSRRCYFLVAAGYLALLIPRKPVAIQRQISATERELSTLRSEVRELSEWVEFQIAVHGPNCEDFISKVDFYDMAKKIDADHIYQPFRCPRLSIQRQSVLRPARIVRD